MLSRCSFFFLFLGCVGYADLGAATADDVLAKMTSAAPKFTSMSASIQRVTYTKVLDEKTTESGNIRIRKQGRELQVLMDVSKPDPKTVALRGRKAEIYLPRLKTIQEYDLGKHGALVDQFLLVGFGTTGRELESAYKVRFAGEETIHGQKTWKLHLAPTTATLREKLQGVVLWISESGEYPVQQQFLEPSGNYYLMTYSDVKLNPGLTDDSLKLRAPKGTKRETVNK